MPHFKYFLVLDKRDKSGFSLPLEQCDIVKGYESSDECKVDYKTNYKSPNGVAAIYGTYSRQWLERNGLIAEVFEQITSNPLPVYQILLCRLANDIDFAYAWVDIIGNSSIQTRMDFIHALQEKGFTITKS